MDPLMPNPQAEAALATSNILSTLKVAGDKIGHTRGLTHHGEA